jgi:DnaJ like chaperone protein
MVFGKIIAGLLGFLVAGPLGLLVGLLVGHNFDKGLAGNLATLKPEQAARVRESFFETTFSVMGHIAKIDGRISAQEVAQAEMVMTQMGLDSSQRQRAIDLFKAGAESEFEVAPTINTFLEHCGKFANLKQTALLYLISLALADGSVHSREREALQGIAFQLGYSAAQFDHLLDMVTAQRSFGGNRSSTISAGDQLSAAYRALGVDVACSDRELKTAYRRLMSEHHPDKLIAQGVPENMVKLATERSQDVQSAYEMLKKHRKAVGGS